MEMDKLINDKHLTMSGDTDDATHGNLATEIICRIIFYSLFVVMLVAFFFVFKRHSKVN